MTPVQVCRNLAGLLKSEDSSQPSTQLNKVVRLDLAARFVAEQQSRTPDSS